MIDPYPVSPYLKRRLRSIEEVLTARKARSALQGDIGAASGFFGRFVAADAGGHRDADDAAKPLREPD